MSFPTREVRLIGVNGDAGLAVTALSSKSLGSRSFKPRDTGANPVRAANLIHCTWVRSDPCRSESSIG